MDNFGPALALCLRLSCDGPDHLVGKVDRLHFYFGYLDPPRVRVEVERRLQSHIELFALTEEVIQFHFPEHAAERGLRKLRCCVKVIADLEHCLSRFDDAEEQD